MISSSRQPRFRMRFLERAALASLTCALPAAASAQARTSDTTATVRVRAVHDDTPIAGAVVRVGAAAHTVGPDGLVVVRVLPGEHTILARRIGFAPDSVRLLLRAGQDTTVDIALAPRAEDAEAIIISSTRLERGVEDTPLRVEVIDEEEVAEKAAMTPGDIAMMMNETSGLRVATTSPSLGGANVRIQGLRGRYTLLLADGMPLYGGQGGFGLLQIPPVDLARAEVIKGTASALYGSSALGGVINLVSRRPEEESQRELLLNQTSRGGTNVVFYTSGRTREESALSASMLASGHRQRENDLDGDGWADMPGYTRAVVRPRVFVDREGVSMLLTAGYTGETRDGGTMPGRLAPDGASHPEGLGTNRFDAGATGRFVVGGRDIISVRASASEQRHRHQLGGVLERDAHRTAFGEVSAMLPRRRVTTVGGFAFQDEQYRNRDVSRFDYRHRVPSVFAQMDVDVAPPLVVSTSARADRHNVYGTSVSPRVSLLLRAPGDGPLAGWTTRLSAGTGTFAPTPLTEETEATGLTPLAPLAGLAQERAGSASLDINGPIETRAGRLELNGTLYASQISNAVIAQETPLSADGELRLVNAPIATRAWGAEGLARWVRGPARVTVSYAYLRATEWDPASSNDARRDVPLAPRHTAGIVGSLEREGESRLGVEVYYTGRQSLADNPYRATSKPYVIVGLLAERQVTTPIARARFFVNAENIGNVRQTRVDPLVLPARGVGGRWTTDAWTELTGATINGGVRLRF